MKPLLLGALALGLILAVGLWTIPVSAEPTQVETLQMLDHVRATAREVAQAEAYELLRWGVGIVVSANGVIVALVALVWRSIGKRFETIERKVDHLLGSGGDAGEGDEET